MARVPFQRFMYPRMQGNTSVTFHSGTSLPFFLTSLSCCVENCYFIAFFLFTVTMYTLCMSYFPYTSKHDMHAYNLEDLLQQFHVPWQDNINKSLIGNVFEGLQITMICWPWFLVVLMQFKLKCNYYAPLYMYTCV